MSRGYRGAGLALVLAGVLFAPVTAYGDDVDDLKAAHEQHIAALNKMDPDAYAAGWHEQMFFFPPLSPFAVDGKTASRQGIQNVFANHESITLTPRDFHYRVIDNTGLVWGHYIVARKPKDGPAVTAFSRYTATYVKSDGTWLLVSSHGSPVQVGN